MAGRLGRLIETVELSRNDRFLAERCLRRIENPLRLTIFGTDTEHSISLLNLMIGQSVVSPLMPRARVQFVYGDEIYARLQFRDGSQERVEGSDFKGLFDRQPSKVRIYANLPVLKKISILVAAEPDGGLGPFGLLLVFLGLLLLICLSAELLLQLDGA